MLQTKKEQSFLVKMGAKILAKECNDGTCPLEDMEVNCNKQFTTKDCQDVTKEDWQAFLDKNLEQNVSELDVKIKKTCQEAKIPFHGSKSSAGYDLYAVSKTESEDKRKVFFDIGLAFEFPEDYVGLIFPRSSIKDTGLIMSNSTGVLDADFRGGIKAVFERLYDEPLETEYNVGDRIAQIVFVPKVFVKWHEVDELTETERGKGGYGSTGRK